MTNLSGMWVKRVAPLDDGFIPYVAPTYYQYNPNLIPSYPQPKEGLTPRTTRVLTLEPQTARTLKRSKPGLLVNSNPGNTFGTDRRLRHSILPNGPDIKVHPMGPDIKVHPMGPDIKVHPMGPDIKGQPTGPDIKGQPTGPDIKGQPTGPDMKGQPTGPDIRYREYKYRPYSTPFKEVKFKQYNTPYREYKYRDSDSDKTGKPKQRRVRAVKKNAQNEETGVVNQEKPDADAWKKPYELAGEAAVLSWIRIQGREGTHRRTRNAVNRYEIEYSPTGAVGRIKS